MSLGEQVEVFEQHEECLAAKAICAASATSQGLAEFEVTEEEPPVENAENWTNKTPWRVRLPRRGASLESDHLHSTLEYCLADPPFYASESPFDVLDGKLAGEEKIRRLINYIRDESKIQFAKKLAARLNFLYEVAKEEDPDEVPISPESLSNFIGFLQKTPNLKYPSVVLTPSNKISAQWRAAPNCHFAVVFLSTGETRFVIFTTNPGDPDKIDRLSGITSVDSLMQTAQPHRVLDWASI
ncbi:MAG: hypothetical protein ACNY01_07855 [Desulfobacteria bacterium]